MWVESEGRSAVVQVYVSPVVGDTYRVVGVGPPGAEGYATVSVRGSTAHADAGPPPDGAVSRSVRFDYAGHVTEGAAGHELELVVAPATPGSVIVLFRDDDREIVGAWGTALPPGDFAAG